MAAKRGLGTGLGALFGEEGQQGSGEEVRLVPIARLEPREAQPRTNFDEESLAELAESIGEYGLIQPVTVRRLNSGYYQIIAGERRWRASRLAGLTEIPVRVVEADDKLATELALVENLQREDLNPLEEAQGYRTLIEEYGLTQEEAAKRVGKSRPVITNALRLLSLAPEVQQFVEQGLLSAGHARALAALRSEDKQLDAARTVIKNGLSVRRTEELAKKLSLPETEDRAGEYIKDDYIREVSKRLESALGRRVKLSEGANNRGKITLEYYDADDREALIAALEAMQNNR